MTTIEPYIGEVALGELDQVEEAAFDMLHMDREMVMEQFDDVYEDTNEKCLATMTCKGMFTSFPIVEVTDGAVRFEGGAKLESPPLAAALGCADEVVLYAAVIHGYEELAKNPENSMFDSMFFDAWGVGYVMSAHRWIKGEIESRARALGRFVGRGWVPGEGDLDLGLLREVFALLDPAQIGIELPDSGLMRPVMSVCGVMGVSDDEGIVDIGKDAANFH